MYVRRVRRKITYKLSKASQAAPLKDVMLVPSVPAPAPVAGPMIRTQIYLSRPEYDFLQTQGARRGEPMAAVIRSFIDEKMQVPDDVWENNPMLAPAADDSSWEGHEDGAINHDHYVYGSPKKWVKQRGKWVKSPPLPDDYFDNPKSRAKHDAKLEKMK